MPLSCIQHLSKDSLFGVWDVRESIEELRSHYPYPLPPSIAILSRALTWYASRILVNQLCQALCVPGGEITTTDKGKPMLGEGVSISLSHSFPYTSAMLHLSKTCGIDMEVARSSLERAGPRFVSPSRGPDPVYSLEDLCRLWCSAEALYKIHGIGNLDFVKDLEVSLKSPDEAVGVIKKQKRGKKVPLRFFRFFDRIIAIGYL